MFGVPNVLHAVILVGPPGSGKSTFARSVQRGATSDWAVINQDTLGSRRACARAMADALGARQHVLIDRCNFDEDQRKPWIDLARWAPVPCRVSAIVLDVPSTHCIERVMTRRSHPTLPGAPESAAVVERMARQLVMPDAREGIDRVVYVRNDGGGELVDGLSPAAGEEAAALRSVPPPSGGWAARAPVAEAAEVRLASFNLLADCWVSAPWYPGIDTALLDSAARLERAAAMLLGVRADVVCLQEAEQRALGGLQRALGAEYEVSELFANEPTRGACANGVAFLVRKDGPLAGRWHAERRVWNAEGSASAILTASVGGGRGGEAGGSAGVELAIMNSHLAWGDAGEDQAARALAWARQWLCAEQRAQRSLLWAGDFNLTPDAEPVLWMKAAGLRDALGWAKTPTYFPPPSAGARSARPKRIDYVLYAPQHAAQASRAFAWRGHGSASPSDSAEDELRQQPARPADADDSESEQAAAASGGASDGSEARGTHARPKRRRGNVGRRRIGLGEALRGCGSDHVPVVATVKVLQPAE